MTPHVALVFPGQGAQHVGMGVDFADGEPAARAVFDEAAEVLQIDLLRICREGPVEALVKTDVQQPAILATGAATVAALYARGRLHREQLRLAFGLSLGEFTALWAAGALSLRDALILVRERGLGMQEASEAEPSGMLAIRAEPAAAEDFAAAVRNASRGVFVVANLNAPGQVVLSGDARSLAVAEELAPAHGIRRPTRLPVAGAFHSPLMRRGAERLVAALEGVRIAEPSVPVLSNATAEATTDPERIRRNLIRQVVEPVYFQGCVERAKAMGATRFLEPAPGRTLAGLMRRIDATIDVVGTPDLASLEALARVEVPS